MTNRKMTVDLPILMARVQAGNRISDPLPDPKFDQFLPPGHPGIYADPEFVLDDDGQPWPVVEKLKKPGVVGLTCPDCKSRGDKDDGLIIQNPLDGYLWVMVHCDNCESIHFIRMSRKTLEEEDDGR